ncbi:hypothetical protein [Rufibacter hautae]|uniref:DUF4890 domain-containing protein n=1 Tax=Rufibacter hautae TaxID=2595005 RepID=A0A5B6T9D1_9BACT|nr:hypothetical protein [Rufibacter hautae]KAA3436798.1 hypothetical protein FOA19_20710 [Rufibacter hautae]
MKKIVVMLSLGMLVTGTTFAQEVTKGDRKPKTERIGQDGGKKDTRTPEEKATQKAQKVTKKYNLTQAQQASLQALYLKQETETAAMKAQSRGAGDVKTKDREDFKAKRAQWDAELKSILTPEQYAQYQADRKAKASQKAGKTAKKGQHLKGKEQKKVQGS